MAWPTLTLRIAFASDPMAASPSWTTVTSDLRSITIKRGRQHELNRMQAGIADLELNNRHGDYWPNNTGGSYYPNVLPNKRINLYAVYAAQTYHLYTGFLEDWNPAWIDQKGGLFPIVRPQCADLGANIARYALNHAGYSQELSGTRIGNVLDDFGWLGGRDIDVGQSYMQASGALADENAWAHLLDVQKSEMGIIYIAGDGDVQHEDRHHRLKGAHLTSQATFGDDAGEKAYHGLNPRFGASQIFNDIRITRKGGTQQAATDSTSQSDYGKRSLSETSLLMTTDNEALDQANFLLKRYKDPFLRTRSLRIVPESHPTDLFPQILGRKISDRITLRRNEADIDEDYFIEGIEHNIDLVNYSWVTTWQLSAVGEGGIYWALGVAGMGELGEKTYLCY